MYVSPHTYFHICIHVYMYIDVIYGALTICVHICLHTHIYTYISTIHTYIESIGQRQYESIHIHHYGMARYDTLKCKHTHMQLCKHMYLYIHAFTHVANSCALYTQTHAHTHTHTHTHAVNSCAST